MSMICFLQRLSPNQMETLLQQPEAVETVVMLTYGEIGSAFPTPDTAALAAMPEALQQAHAAMAAQIAAAQSAMPGFGPLAPVLDLQKSWHIFNYLFTGETWGEPPPNALVAGTPLGEDMGYGPARLHDPAGTAAFAAFLSGLDLPTLLSKIDLAAMDEARIYGLPGGPSPAENEADLRDEVAGYFPLLRAYVAEAAAAGDGILTWLS